MPNSGEQDSALQDEVPHARSHSWRTRMATSSRTRSNSRRLGANTSPTLNADAKFNMKSCSSSVFTQNWRHNGNHRRLFFGHYPHCISWRRHSDAASHTGPLVRILSLQNWDGMLQDGLPTTSRHFSWNAASTQQSLSNSKEASYMKSGSAVGQRTKPNLIEASWSAPMSGKLSTMSSGRRPWNGIPRLQTLYNLEVDNTKVLILPPTPCRASCNWRPPTSDLVASFSLTLRVHTTASWGTLLWAPPAQKRNWAESSEPWDYLLNYFRNFRRLPMVNVLWTKQAVHNGSRPLETSSIDAPGSWHVILMKLLWRCVGPDQETALQICFSTW